MTRNSNILMAALTLTAIVLGAILLAGHEPQARGSMLNSQDSFSLMTTGVVGNDEALVILDKGTQEMVVYKLVNGNDLRVIAGWDLAK